VRIEVLGMGCAQCDALYENVLKAVEESGVEAQIVKVEDMETIIERGVMMTPALVMDGEVRVSGRAVSSEEIKRWLV